MPILTLVGDFEWQAKAHALTRQTLVEIIHLSPAKSLSLGVIGGHPMVKSLTLIDTAFVLGHSG
jgi:hypothetical protein